MVGDKAALPCTAVGGADAMGVHMLMTSQTRGPTMYLIRLEMNPRWFISLMVPWRFGTAATGVYPAVACAKYAAAGSRDVCGLTVGISRFSSINSFRAMDGALLGPDLALNGPYGPRGHTGFAGGHHARSIWPQPEALGFGQHVFSLGQRCSFSLASHFQSWSSGGGDKGSP
jgi:hypothetical protein